MAPRVLEDLRQTIITGSGFSSTKAVFLATGFGALIAALALTGAFCWRYLVHGTADGSFAGAMGALWAIVMGGATGAQNRKAAVDKEVDVAKIEEGLIPGGPMDPPA